MEVFELAENTGDEQRKRGEGRRFAKGQSGNSAGRPKGARNRTTLAVENLLHGEAEAITRKAVDMAKNGDTVALRLVLERVAPLRRGRPVYFDLPPIETALDVSTALGRVLAATAQGELTPDEAATIAGLLETKRKAIETLEIETRLAALEQMWPGGVADEAPYSPRTPRAADAGEWQAEPEVDDRGRARGDAARPFPRGRGECKSAG